MDTTAEKKDLRTVISIKFVDGLTLLAFFDSFDNNIICVTEPKSVSQSGTLSKYFTATNSLCSIPIQGNVRMWAEADENDREHFLSNIEMWEKWKASKNEKL